MSGWVSADLHQDRRWLTSAVLAAMKTNTWLAGEGGRQGSCLHPAAESEKLIIARQSVMHPMVIELSLA
jgi:hypothetical protein